MKVQIDLDVAESTLTLKDGLAVMDLRKERKGCEKKIKAMAASFAKRRQVHDDRIAEIDVRVAELMKSDG